MELFSKFYFQVVHASMENTAPILYFKCLPCDDTDHVYELFFWFYVHVGSMELSTYRVISSVGDVILFNLLKIFISFLVALSRTFNTTLNKNCQEQTSLFCFLSYGKSIQSFNTKYDVSYGFSQMPFISLKMFPVLRLFPLEMEIFSWSPLVNISLQLKSFSIPDFIFLNICCVLWFWYFSLEYLFVDVLLYFPLVF